MGEKPSSYEVVASPDVPKEWRCHLRHNFSISKKNESPVPIKKSRCTGCRTAAQIGTPPFPMLSG